MNTKQLNKNTSDVYSISGFRDTLASPIFYPVIVVAMVLGITSILGFVQNPLKLKSMVGVIHQKVVTSNVVKGSLEDQLYRVSKETQIESQLQTEVHTFNSFDLFTDENQDSEKVAIDDSIERIAFNYDLTSENFWNTMDPNELLDTSTKELERKDTEQNHIGTPLEINKIEKIPARFELNDISIYALNNY